MSKLTLALSWGGVLAGIAVMVTAAALHDGWSVLLGFGVVGGAAALGRMV